MSTADDAWQEWREIDDNEWHAHPITRSALDFGYRRALEDAADALEAQKPPEGYVVVLTERVGDWLRDRAAAVGTKDGDDDAN